jgi:hypothetical protein
MVADPVAIDQLSLTEEFHTPIIGAKLLGLQYSLSNPLGATTCLFSLVSAFPGVNSKESLTPKETG